MFMIIPSARKDIEEFCAKIVDRCTYSEPTRSETYNQLTTLYRTGTRSGQMAKHNKCYTHIDKISSLIYSPQDVRFSLEFEDDENPLWANKLRVATKHLNRQFIRRNVHISLSTAIEAACYLGSYFIKVTYSSDGYNVHLIHPSDIGVDNESLNSLNDQECFVHTMRVSKHSIRRQLFGHPKRDELMKKLDSATSVDRVDSISNNYSVFTDGIGNLQTGGVAGSGRGSMLPTGQMSNLKAALSPESLEDLVEMYEIWVQDDDMQNWTTLRYIKPGIVLEGMLFKRNLSDAPDCVPFVKICPKEVPDYFFGASFLEPVISLQELKNKRFDQIDNIYARQINPARIAKGFSSMTDEKLLALLTPGGTFVDSDPNGKVDEFKPELPQGSLEYLHMLDAMFEDAGGFTPVMSGQGDQGIRSGNHAQSALRMSGPRIRDAAITVETQVAEVGELCYRISQAKNANVFKDERGDEFLLAQIPDDAFVAVDSHTTSPIFSGENENRAFALRKMDAIDNESLIEMLHVPKSEELIAKLHKRDAQKAQLMAEHPELLQGKGKGKH
jgi:regulator of sigma D